MDALKHFTDPERTGVVGKCDLSEPWVEDGFEYATNGYIVVRVLTDKPDTKTDKNVNAKQLFDMRFLPRQITIEQPEILNKCCDCNGKGWVYDNCNKCGGDGYALCPTCREYTLICDKCGGSGADGTKKHTCNECLGSGEQYKNIELSTGHKIAGRCIYLIKKYLPGAEITGVSINNVKIKFDGGECIVRELT